ncbi:hypothetical protein J4558_27385 [Leptolyngbya sp. 15MV]|nr:hypothetical protein J4558_27385 [Leptolyngbya sp. 15MV]
MPRSIGFQLRRVSSRVGIIDRSVIRCVRGIYLEGDVQASDGRYNLRAPRMYYSVADNRALILDAVFWTFDQRRNLPLYVRAKAIRQESADEFRATSARLTNTAFFDPELSIGASAVTITRAPSPQGDQRLFVDARNVTLRAGGVPFFYLPRLRGEADQPPLRDVRVENSNASGAAFKTTWNLPVLLGLRARREITSDLLVDYYFDRGLAFGTDTRWAGENNAGGLFAYAVPSDNGRDVLASGERRDRDGEFRGIITLEHRARISDRWTIIAEASHISDATFLDGFFEPLARNRREFTSRLTARRLDENTVLTATVQGTLDRFIANQYLLQSPGYTVERLPDVRYVRLADNVLEDYPGLLTYSAEYRASSMRALVNKVHY